MGFSAIVKGNHSHMVFLDTPLHVDVVTDMSKLPLHKYLKGEQFKNSHPYNPPASLSPPLDNMKVLTELTAGLCITADRKRSNLKHQDSTACPLLFLTSPFLWIGQPHIFTYCHYLY